jgi:1D-myo-inositol-triphosphate 3-kinase
MEDLLYNFKNPSIMDIKIGVRTFLEDENNEKETQPREDLYMKLLNLDPDELTAEEHEIKKINKRRYMSWREKSTCSKSLGFRIEAIKVKISAINQKFSFLFQNHTFNIYI